MVKKLYMDQCMVSNLANQGCPWHETRAGKALADALKRKVIEVWVSPTHVLETYLCAEFDDAQGIIDTPQLDLRQAIASTLVHLADGRRMAPSYEFIMIEDFMRMLETEAPGCVYGWKPFNWLRRQNTYIYMGILGLLAAYRPFNEPEAFAGLERSKLTSELLFSRFARAPADYFDDVLAAAREYRVTREDIWAELDRRSFSDLKREKQENEAAAVRLTGGVIQRLQRDREMVARAYGAVELGQCITSVFSDPVFLLLTFDMARIRDQWGQIVGRDVRPPAFLAEADDERCHTDDELAVRSLEILFRAVAPERLYLSQLIYKIVLGEIELALRQEEIPTGGLGFDSEHAAILGRVDAFGTVDLRFATLARRAAAEMATAGHSVQILVGFDELIQFLERL
jgi:hypothetical protein